MGNEPHVLEHRLSMPAAKKMLEVYAYYKGKDGSEEDDGTLLRFIEIVGKKESDARNLCILPGLSTVEATFDGTSYPAYCDHWVSNVVSRTGFLDTLEDTLGFSPKVDFNAGVVAAGEAQIESTVTGNTTATTFSREASAAALKETLAPHADVRIATCLEETRGWSDAVRRFVRGLCE